jgi:hypothetical protein
MGFSALTIPHTYMAAYSAIPLKVFDTNYNQIQQYKYIINATYDTMSVSAAAPYTYQSNIYTELTTSGAHSFSIGDTILLDDTINSNNLTGYYNILFIPSSTSIVVDLFPATLPVLYPLSASRFYKWKLTPDPNGYGKLDMSNVMKDLVSQNLTGQTNNYTLTYDGPDTKKCFGLVMGYEGQYTFEFEDNIFMSGGTVGFQNSAITGFTGIPFQIGDVIQIAQNAVAWGYTGITNDGTGFARYSSNLQHSFSAGQTIQVAGQTSIPYYNGYTSIRSTPVVTTTSLSSNQTFQSTSTTAGYIYGVPKPSYNTTAIITSLTIDPVYGLIIGTNLAFAGNSIPISGTIRFSGNQLQQFPNIYINYDLFCVYNAHINRADYTINAFDPYVVQNRSFSGNNISTILSGSTCYRIEPSTIGFLLSHQNSANYADGVYYQFYNSAGTSLGSVYLVKPTGSSDFYSPIGLGQISGSSYVNYSGTFATYITQIVSYTINTYNSTGVPSQSSNKICFKLNNDCSMYEIYHLMWKDQYGSFISYPFIYVSRDYIESEKKTYYQQEGNWENNTFDYEDYGVGEKVFYERSRESLTLNSGWLYEFERYLINDLVQSPSVYIQTPDNRLFNCHLDQPKTEIYKNINEQLFSYTFNVRVSNNEFRF